MIKYSGIDVSLYQGEIDWERVKRDGVDFAMIKASQGRTADYPSPFMDPYFERNIKGAAAAGLYVGAYHYLCAATVEDARKEAMYFAGTLKPYMKNIQLWAAVDVEDDGFMGGLSGENVTQIVSVFCDTVASQGFRPMVYANSYWLDSRFSAPVGIPVWEARIGGNVHPERAKVWQRSFTGRVDGIGNDVDLNEGYDIIGDADGDGKVTTADAVLVLKRLAGWNVNIDEGQADVNSDGKVTASDVISILRKSAGWR